MENELFELVKKLVESPIFQVEAVPTANTKDIFNALGEKLA